MLASSGEKVSKKCLPAIVENDYPFKQLAAVCLHPIHNRSAIQSNVITVSWPPPQARARVGMKSSASHAPTRSGRGSKHTVFPCSRIDSTPGFTISPTITWQKRTRSWPVPAIVENDYPFRQLATGCLHPMHNRSAIQSNVITVSLRNRAKSRKYSSSRARTREHDSSSSQPRKNVAVKLGMAFPGLGGDQA